MTVRHGRRYVRIFSPMSLLAVGSVALCSGLAALFVAKLLPEDLLTREFQTVAFWLGLYFLAIGVPSLAAFTQKVVETPTDVDDASGAGFDTLLGLFIILSSTAGFLGVGGWLAFAQPDYFAFGVAFCLFGLLDALVLVPLGWYLYRERAAQS